VFGCDLSEKPLKNLAKGSDFQAEYEAFTFVAEGVQVWNIELIEENGEGPPARPWPIS
jgi:hypothetical protein